MGFLKSLAVWSALTVVVGADSLQTVRIVETKGSGSDSGVSAFGSSSSQVRHFDFEASDWVPKEVLTRPGQSLKAVVIEPDLPTEIRVEGEEFGDEYLLRFGDGIKSLSFTADYGNFAVFTHDLNQDGINEVLIEHGHGRGTSVYERRLSIFEPVHFNGLPSKFVEIKHIQLSGWLVDDAGIPSGSWAKSYAFIKDEDGWFISVKPME